MKKCISCGSEISYGNSCYNVVCVNELKNKRIMELKIKGEKIFFETFKCDIKTVSEDYGLCYIKFIQMLERDFGFNRWNDDLNNFLKINFGDEVDDCITIMLID